MLQFCIVGNIDLDYWIGSELMESKNRRKQCYLFDIIERNELDPLIFSKNLICLCSTTYFLNTWLQDFIQSKIVYYLALET